MRSRGVTRTQERPEDKVIEAFVAYLADKLYPGLHITDWPDKKGGSRREIDAVAESSSKRVAIEHTSIDYLPDQRRDNDHFMQVIGTLKSEFHEGMNSRVHLTVPFGAVPTGTDWEGIRDALRHWILTAVPLLPEGDHRQKIEGVPFEISVRISRHPPYGLLVGRWVQDDPSFDRRFQDQVTDKAGKFAEHKYKDGGYLTILLIENDDLANVNRGWLITAVQQAHAANPTAWLDRIWHADTSVPTPHEFWNLTPSSRAKLDLMSATEELENPPE